MDDVVEPLKEFLGIEEDGHVSKPKKHYKPKGCWMYVQAVLKALIILALFGYFIYLLVELFQKYIEDTNDPPLKVTESQKLYKKSGDPKFPAMAVCHPGFNLSVDLIQVGFSTASNNSVEYNCYPDDSGGGTCESGFPTNRVNFWKFIIQFPGAGGSRRRRLEYEVTSESLELFCLAMNLTGIDGFSGPQANAKRQQLTFLFKYPKVPDQISKITSSSYGLDGLNAYFFATADVLPGAKNQSSRSSAFSELTSTPEYIKSGDFQKQIDDRIIIGKNLMTQLGIRQTRTIPLSGETKIHFQTSSTLAAPLNIENFINEFNPEVQSNATDSLGFSYLTLSYSTISITLFESDLPEFSKFLASIGGLKAVVFDFWAIAIILFFTITRLQNNPKEAFAEAKSAGKKGAVAAAESIS